MNDLKQEKQNYGHLKMKLCVEVARLPKDLLIEVEVTAIKDR